MDDIMVNEYSLQMGCYIMPEVMGQLVVLRQMFKYADLWKSTGTIQGHFAPSTDVSDSVRGSPEFHMAVEDHQS